MSIRLSCPCGKVLQARDEDAGRQAQCPVCGGVVVVPGERGEERLGEVDNREAPVLARMVICRACRGEFASEEIYDDDGRLVCRHCYVGTASEPVRSSTRRPVRRVHHDNLAIDNHLPLAFVALLATFFCCGLPVGLVPMIFALMVDGAVEREEYDRARRLSSNAYVWSVVSLSLVGIWVVAGLALFALLVIAG